MIGVAGVLQFEVLEYRLKNEYHVDITMQVSPYVLARWLVTKKSPEEISVYSGSISIVEDQYQRPVMLFKDPWTLNNAVESNKDVAFLDIMT